MMKASEIRELTAEELSAKLGELKLPISSTTPTRSMKSSTTLLESTP